MALQGMQPSSHTALARGCARLAARLCPMRPAVLSDGPRGEPSRRPRAGGGRGVPCGASEGLWVQAWEPAYHFPCHLFPCSLVAQGPLCKPCSLSPLFSGSCPLCRLLAVEWELRTQKRPHLRGQQTLLLADLIPRLPVSLGPSRPPRLIRPTCQTQVPTART